MARFSRMKRLTALLKGGTSLMLMVSTPAEGVPGVTPPPICQPRLFMRYLILSIPFGILLCHGTPISAAPVDITDTVTQYGITWTFDKARPVGKYATGDWWVVGPVTIKSVTPIPEKGRNGAVINPKAGDRQGYDDRLAGFDAGMGSSFPLEFKPGQSLVSTESLADPHDIPPDCIYPPNPLKEYALRTAAVLTCVDHAPPEDSFRPAYVGTWRETFRVAQLRRNLLPNLEPPAGLPDVAKLERALERIWLDHRTGFQSNYFHPLANMPDYGREITNIVSETGLVLMLRDQDQKRETLLLRFIQKGIDNYGVVQSNPKIWTADGGHDSGRKLPILFAGVLLNHEGMMHVKASFAEDEQTYHGNGFNGQKALWTINPSNINARHEEADPADWKTFGKGANNGTKAEGYRRLNGPTWVGQALVARLIGAVGMWDHPPYFDYVDRWCSEEKEKAANPFVRAMWEKYRARADEIAAESRQSSSPAQ